MTCARRQGGRRSEALVPEEGIEPALAVRRTGVEADRTIETLEILQLVYSSRQLERFIPFM
jgi:hypothetical protein